MYEIQTIGDLAPQTPPATAPVTDGPTVAIVAVLGVAAGALGFWAITRLRKKGRR